MFGQVIVWDWRTGKVLHRLLGHTGPVEGVAFSPDGKRLATASWDKTVKVWDTATWKVLHTLRGHGEYVRSVAFSSDGKVPCLRGRRSLDHSLGRDLISEAAQPERSYRRGVRSRLR